MKLRITHLKAPWPAGARVGDVIDLPEVPAWAVGKCTPAPHDAEVTVELPPTPVVAEADAAPAPADASGDVEVAYNSLQGAMRIAIESLTDLRSQVEELEQRIADAKSQAQSVQVPPPQAKRTEADEKATDALRLAEQQAERERAAAEHDRKAELVKEAEGLGIAVDKRWGVDRLAEAIAAKAPKAKGRA